MLYDFLKEKGYEIDDKSNGININYDNNDLVIKGTKYDLIELANYIINVAISNNDKDHLHLDDLTIINEESNIKNLIIEKE